MLMHRQISVAATTSGVEKVASGSAQDTKIRTIINAKLHSIQIIWQYTTRYLLARNGI